MDDWFSVDQVCSIRRECWNWLTDYVYSLFIIIKPTYVIDCCLGALSIWLNGVVSVCIQYLRRVCLWLTCMPFECYLKLRYMYMYMYVPLEHITHWVTMYMCTSLLCKVLNNHAICVVVSIAITDTVSIGHIFREIQISQISWIPLPFAKLKTKKVPRPWARAIQLRLFAKNSSVKANFAVICEI